MASAVVLVLSERDRCHAIAKVAADLAQAVHGRLSIIGIASKMPWTVNLSPLAPPICWIDEDDMAIERMERLVASVAARMPADVPVTHRVASGNAGQVLTSLLDQAPNLTLVLDRALLSRRSLRRTTDFWLSHGSELIATG